MSQIAASQETGRKLVAEQLQAQEREIGKTLNERLENVTQRVGETIQKTTDKTSESCTDLQKRLGGYRCCPEKHHRPVDGYCRVARHPLEQTSARRLWSSADGRHRARHVASGVFQFEATLSNGKRVDCLITPCPASKVTSG